MAVYVDEPLFEWRGRTWCHLTADGTTELHVFAARIGLRRAWFQTRPDRPWRDHYDVPESRRADAIAAGAIEITWREAGRRLVDRRRALGG